MKCRWVCNCETCRFSVHNMCWLCCSLLQQFQLLTCETSNKAGHLSLMSLMLICRLTTSCLLCAKVLHIKSLMTVLSLFDSAISWFRSSSCSSFLRCFLAARTDAAAHSSPYLSLFCVFFRVLFVRLLFLLNATVFWTYWISVSGADLCRAPVGLSHLSHLSFRFFG